MTKKQKRAINRKAQNTFRANQKAKGLVYKTYWLDEETADLIKTISKAKGVTDNTCIKLCMKLTGKKFLAVSK